MFSRNYLAHLLSSAAEKCPCIVTGKDILIVTEAENCPCFLSVKLPRNIPKLLTGIRIQLFVLTPEDYAAWMPSLVSRFYFPVLSLENYWLGLRIPLNYYGKFKIIARASRSNSSVDCDFGTVILRGKTATCPLRLASRPEAQTFVLGGTILDEWSEYSRYDAQLSTGCSG